MRSVMERTGKGQRKPTSLSHMEASALTMYSNYVARNAAHSQGAKTAALSAERGGSQRTLGSSLDDGWMTAPLAKDPRRGLSEFSPSFNTCVSFRGAGHGAGHRRQRESAPWELTVHRRTRKPHVLYLSGLTNK